MKLRKCPSCRDMVGGESVVCPRCGANFQAALLRQIVIRVGAVLLVVWLVSHFLFKHF